MALYIGIGIAVLLILYVISVYNKLIKLRINRENAFADIDVQLKQRFDLIPQLVNTVKGYMDHESDVLKAITLARSGVQSAKTIDEKIVAEAGLTSALSGLNIQVEAYPDLKANQNFLELQSEISDIENKLAAVRRFFNSATKEFNVALQVFPANIVAGMFGFKDASFFEIADDKREQMEAAPEVSFK